ncbi:MAG: DNA methyltransferase, partial [Nitrososphaerales archaeon]
SNVLYYGDNLDILKRYIPNHSVDLIYLDPPFNSQADYNILFKEQSGEQSTAQIQAFSDFWHWDTAARNAYEYLTGNEVDSKVADLAEALYKVLGKNDMSAYLYMMATRLIELHRVLKPTGSLYLHCDPRASHYLKSVLDAIFGFSSFRNEIVWVRTTGHRDSHKYNQSHDIIFFYTKSDRFTWNPQYIPYDEDYIKTNFRNVEPKTNRRFMADNLLAAGIRKGESGKPWHGIDPTNTGNHWQYTVQKLDELDRQGLIYWPPRGKMPRLKRYLDTLDGKPLTAEWTDIPSVGAHAEERLGYPTQKPTQLLERIIKASTNEGDWILDPFCGCGTAITTAEKLRRCWIGIDITYLAINLVKHRLQDMFPDVKFKVEGEPRDLGAAMELAKNRYQFQWWALSLIRARPLGSKPANPREGKKGADEGVDGWLRFADGPEGHIERIVVQVKSGHVGVKDIRELRDVVTSQKAAMGIFITLEEPASEMIKEVKATDPYVSPTWGHEYPKIQITTVE